MEKKADEFTREQLVEQLRKSDVCVHFTKRDGSERTMFCTLREEATAGYFVAQDPDKPKKEKKENEEVVVVWDLDKKTWRSFRLDSLLKVVYED